MLRLWRWNSFPFMLDVQLKLFNIPVPSFSYFMLHDDAPHIFNRRQVWNEACLVATLFSYEATLLKHGQNLVWHCFAEICWGIHENGVAWMVGYVSPNSVFTNGHLLLTSWLLIVSWIVSGNQFCKNIENYIFPPTSQSSVPLCLAWQISIHCNQVCDCKVAKCGGKKNHTLWLLFQGTTYSFLALMAWSQWLKSFAKMKASNFCEGLTFFLSFSSAVIIIAKSHKHCSAIIHLLECCHSMLSCTFAVELVVLVSDYWI